MTDYYFLHVSLRLRKRALKLSEKAINFASA